MKYTNKHNLPKTLTDVIDKQTYDISKSNPNRISVTTLINPPRVKLLGIRHWKELSEDYSEHLWRIVGSAYHYILAKTKEDNRLVEEKMVEKIGDMEVVCKPDLYDEPTAEVSDWKITSLWHAKDYNLEWELQLNCYAWALRKLGFEVKKLVVNALLKDWRNAELRRYDDYPPIPFKQIEVKLWSFEDQDKFVHERVALYLSLKDAPDDKLPLCTPEERWQTQTKYAVYNNENKTATRVLDSMEQAQGFIVAENTKTPKNKYRIDIREGTDIRCANYCSVCVKCDYWKLNYGQK